MWDGKIDLTGEFIAFAQHRAAPPFNKFGPHFPDNNERRVIKLTDLQELPCERQLQKSSNTTWNYHESIGDDHEMVQPRKEGTMFVRLTDEWVNLLLKW
jgi:hypothetical protein